MNCLKLVDGILPFYFVLIGFLSFQLSRELRIANSFEVILTLCTNVLMLGPDHLTVCSNALTVCSNTLTVCSNALTDCSNTLTVYSNAPTVCVFERSSD